MKLTFQPAPPPPRPFDLTVFTSRVATCGCCSAVNCALCEPTRGDGVNMWSYYLPDRKGHLQDLEDHWEEHHA